MKIREASKEDVPKILPIWRELMDFHAQRDSYYLTREGAEEAFSKYVCGNIEKDDASVFVAQENNDLVGYCQCLIVNTPPVLVIEKYGNIGDIAVLGKYRRNGVGQKLVEQAIKWFQLHGLERVEVRAAVTNEISTKFWRKAGFITFAETMYQSLDLPERA